jgi:hypothetical protein
MKKSNKTLKIAIQTLKSFKSFLKYVPGFRSGEKVNIILGSIYYIFCFLLLIAGIIFRVNTIRVAISLIFTPFLIFAGLDSLNNN